MGESSTYRVLRSFNVFSRGEDVQLDPESAGTAALLRAGYIEPAEAATPETATPKSSPQRRRRAARST